MSREQMNVRLGESTTSVVLDNNGAIWTAHIDGRQLQCTAFKLPGGSYSVIVNGHSYRLTPGTEKTVTVASGAHSLRAVVQSVRDGTHHQAGTIEKSTGALAAPMPGKVVSILVKEGELVRAGQGIIVLEAMKMENEMKSAVDGTVSRIAVSLGQTVESNAALVDITPLEASP